MNTPNMFTAREYGREFVKCRVFVRIVVCLGMALIGATTGHAADPNAIVSRSRRRHVSKSS